MSFSAASRTVVRIGSAGIIVRDRRPNNAHQGMTCLCLPTDRYPAPVRLTVPNFNADPAPRVGRAGANQRDQPLSGPRAVAISAFSNAGSLNLDAVDPSTNLPPGVSATASAKLAATGDIKRGGYGRTPRRHGRAADCKRRRDRQRSCAARGARSGPRCRGRQRHLRQYQPVQPDVRRSVLLLQNHSTGDIVLNAYGGAFISTMVNNTATNTPGHPGGSVTLNTFSPLDVNFGIDAGNNIFLSTAGVRAVGHAAQQRVPRRAIHPRRRRVRGHGRSLRHPDQRRPVLGRHHQADLPRSRSVGIPRT